MRNDVSNLIAQRLDVSVRRYDEATVRALLDAAADGVCLHHLDGAIVEFNQCFADMVGYGRDEMRALNIADIILGASAEIIQADFRKAAEDGLRRVAELRLRRKDGSVVNVESSMKALELGGRTYIYATSRDLAERKRAEQALEGYREEVEAKNNALAASERRFSDAIANAPIPMALLTTDLRLLEINDALCELLGYAREEMLGARMTEYLAPDEAGASFANLRRLAAGEVAALRVTRHGLHRSGRRIPVQVDVSVVRRASGEVEYFIAQGRDISERLAYEARLKTLLNVAVDGVCIHDFVGRIVEFSQSLADMLGYSRAELAALNVADIDARRSEIVLSTAAAGDGVLSETRYRRNDGTFIDVEVICKAIALDGKTYIYSSSRDITERTQMAAALAEDRKLLQAVLDASPYGKALFDSRLDCVLQNENYGQILDLPQGLLDRRPLTLTDSFRFRHVRGDFGPNCGGLAFDRSLIEVLRSWEAEGRPLRSERRLGNGRWVEKRFVFLPSGHLLETCLDITDYKQIEADLRLAKAQAEDAKARAEAANTAKSEFLSNISHEIRTPLNAILGMTQLLARTPLDTQQRKFVQRLDSAGENMLVLLSDVLDLSKIEAGQLTLEQASFDLPELLESVRDTFSVSANRKGLTLSVAPLPAKIPTLVGDPTRLRQIVINFVGNAIKFTERGGITISVEALDRSIGRIRLRISVQDNGIGISPENIGRLFEPFVQAERTTYRKFGGTGLGLSISKRLVAMMGGEIGVESEPGSGSNFWFVVTLKTSALTATKETPFEVSPGERKLSGMRLLIVDDTETNREIASQLLGSEGAVCKTAENGRAAVERLRVGPNDFDCVLMDVQMPEMDGIEATRAIRYDLGLADLPVIALTAGAMASQKEQALAAGMNGFVGKPFRLRDLVAALTPWRKGEKGRSQAENLIGTSPALSDDPHIPAWMRARAGQRSKELKERGL